MGSTRRRFTDEYKQHAVRLVLDSGDSIAEIARSIGVHEMTLGKWVKKARDDGEESLDRIEFGGQAVDSARVSRPEERLWDRHDVGSPMNTNSTQ